MSREMEILINESPVKIDLGYGRERLEYGFLGPLGTYTDEATDLLLGRHRLTFSQTLCRSNPEVVRIVDEGNLDLGIVPTENAIEGNVMETLRTLVRARNLTILGEGNVKIDHMLIGRPGERIRKIYSHPQALGQCSEFLGREYPDAELIPTSSTTGAVEQIQGMADTTVAAIANRRSAEIYRMNILAKSIGDNQHNTTRFWLIGKGETEPTGDDITSFVFIPKEDRPGILRDCLDVLAMHGLNLTRIDSHPTGRIDQYIFIASHRGHYKDEMARRAHILLEERYCSTVRILGSYRKAQLPEGTYEPGAINGNGQ